MRLPRYLTVLFCLALIGAHCGGGGGEEDKDTGGQTDTVQTDGTGNDDSGTGEELPGGEEVVEVVEETSEVIDVVEDVVEAETTDIAEDVQGGDWSEKYGTGCSLSNRVGKFEVKIADWGSVFAGDVKDGIDALQDLQPQESEGGCTVYQRLNPFCDPACSGTEQCTHAEGCKPFPTPLNAGTIKVTGLSVPVSVDPVGPAKQYQKYDFIGDPFEIGAEIELTAPGNEVEGFALQGHGVSMLDVPDKEWKIFKQSPLTVEWVADPDSPGEIHFLLNIDQHGLSPATIYCAVEDTGSHTIPAALIDALYKYGVSGAASGQMTRRTVDSVMIDEGCVQFEVLSDVQVYPEAEGGGGPPPGE